MYYLSEEDMLELETRHDNGQLDHADINDLLMYIHALEDLLDSAENGDAELVHGWRQNID